MRWECLGALAAVAASVSACASAAPPPAASSSAGPRLLVVISVDQFAADLFDQYRPQFSGGIARIAGGTVFRNGYQSHAATETCPGHSTILTGDHPSRTGIVGNTWVDQSVGRSDVTVYCAEDERAPGSSSTAYKVSGRHLLVPTLGELIKARWPGSRSVAVSGKDRAAVMMSGQNVDQRYYWTGAKFVTDQASARVPAVVARVNALAAAGLSGARDPLQLSPFCQGKSREIAIEGGGKPVGAGAFARGAGDQAAFRASPEFDGDTLAMAAALLDELQLGKRADPDILAVSLSATDYVGHAYGTEGAEMCLQLTELDRELGDFLAVLDARKIDYSVVLTADHGGLDIPERMRAAGLADAARVTANLYPAVMGAALVRQLGLSGPGLLGSAPYGDIAIDRRLRAPERERLLKAAVAAYRADPQVEAVFTARQVGAIPVPRTSPEKWSLIERARASYYPGRSGDLIVFLKRDITPIAETSRYIATHGSPWDYDRRVPILFWRPGASGTTIERSVETTDIMPTLASMIGLPVQAGSIDGHCLADVPGAHCPGR